MNCLQNQKYRKSRLLKDSQFQMFESEDDFPNMVDSLPMEDDLFESSQVEARSVGRVPMSDLSPGEVNSLDPYRYSHKV